MMRDNVEDLFTAVRMNIEQAEHDAKRELAASA
jgi:hypothetical protein